jgi:8-oxo-dGTP pyrophosphatase MutT (NUDIX family)
MALQPWPELGRERLTRFKIFEVLRVRRRSPRTDEPHDFFVVDTWDWVNIVAFTEAGELVLVEQYRHGPGAFTLEIPGGAVHPGEDPALAAVRELREESGYASAQTPILLGAVNPNPALFTNRCSTWLLRDCRRVGDVEPDPGEDLRVVTLPLDEVESRVRRGEIDHALVLDALYLFRLHEARS